jgi:hypothetical protein
MIYIHHDKEIIFVHVPKTGGSYVGSMLTTYYGFTSFVYLFSKKRPDHEKICRGRVASHNELYDGSFFNRSLGVFAYASECPEWSKEMGMTPEKWARYKKFCFIRNPLTRFISGWNHMNIIFQHHTSISAYIKQPLNIVSDIEYGHVWMSQVEHLWGNVRPGVDFIGRFESLERDLCAILREFGFSIKHTPVKLNSANLPATAYKIPISVARFLYQRFNQDVAFYNTNWHI